MGKRTNKFLASPVFRSLPDFSTRKPNSSNNLTPKRLKPNIVIPAEPSAINVNGKGLGTDSHSDKPRIQVRPDWAAKYLK